MKRPCSGLPLDRLLDLDRHWHGRCYVRGDPCRIEWACC